MDYNKELLRGALALYPSIGEYKHRARQVPVLKASLAVANEKLVDQEEEQQQALENMSGKVQKATRRLRDMSNSRDRVLTMLKDSSASIDFSLRDESMTLSTAKSYKRLNNNSLTVGGIKKAAKFRRVVDGYKNDMKEFYSEETKRIPLGGWPDDN